MGPVDAVGVQHVAALNYFYLTIAGFGQQHFCFFFAGAEKLKAFRCEV